MSKINDIIGKIGVDKFAHLGIAGFIVAASGLFGWIPASIAFVAVSVAGVVKELSDERADWFDFLAGEIGAVVALALAIVAFFV